MSLTVLSTTISSFQKYSPRSLRIKLLFVNCIKHGELGEDELEHLFCDPLKHVIIPTKQYLPNTAIEWRKHNFEK